MKLCESAVGALRIGEEEVNEMDSLEVSSVGEK